MGKFAFFLTVLFCISLSANAMTVLNCQGSVSLNQSDRITTFPFHNLRNTLIAGQAAQYNIALDEGYSAVVYVGPSAKLNPAPNPDPDEPMTIPGKLTLTAMKIMDPSGETGSAFETASLDVQDNINLTVTNNLSDGSGFTRVHVFCGLVRKN